MSVAEPAGVYLLIVSLLSLLATAFGCWRIQVSQSLGNARTVLLWTSVSLAVAVLAMGTVIFYDKSPRFTCAEAQPRLGCRDG